MTNENRLIAALKRVKHELLIPAAEYVPAIPACWEIIDAALASSSTVSEMDDVQVHHIVRRACENAGSIAAWARSRGLTDEQVRLFLTGKRPPEPKLLKALGLRRRVTYQDDGTGPKGRAAAGKPTAATSVGMKRVSAE